MRKTPIAHTTALILGSAISSVSFGSGFSLNEQSAKSLGQAFSGRASDAADASTIAGNPAGMSHLKQGEISGGFIVIDASTDIKSTSGRVGPGLAGSYGGSNDGDMVPTVTVPFLYYVQPLDPHWAVGFGIYAPFGLATEYENGFQGRYFGTDSDVKVITLQPTASYRFDNGLSLGLGVTYNTIDGKLSKNSFTGTPVDSESKVKGDDTAWGYNIGILYELNESTRFGLSYYSEVDYKLEGHTNISNIPFPLSVPVGGSSVRYDATLDVTTPAKIDFGFTHSFTPELTLHGDVTRTNWSSLDELKVKNKNAYPLLAESTETLNWDDAWFYSLGLSYQLNPQWVIRGGIAYDESPIPDSTRTVRIPSNDRMLYSIGATWDITKEVSLDFAYLYLKEKTAEINQTGLLIGTTTPIAYSAKYNNESNVFGLQLNWKL